MKCLSRDEIQSVNGAMKIINLHEQLHEQPGLMWHFLICRFYSSDGVYLGESTEERSLFRGFSPNCRTETVNRNGYQCNTSYIEEEGTCSQLLADWFARHGYRGYAKCGTM